MKKYLAEMVGTFVLTFLGCGAAVSLNCGVDTASVVGTAIAFGLSVVAMAYAIGGICFSRSSVLSLQQHCWHSLFPPTLVWLAAQQLVPMPVLLRM